MEFFRGDESKASQEHYGGGWPASLFKRPTVRTQADETAEQQAQSDVNEAWSGRTGHSSGGGTGVIKSV